MKALRKYRVVVLFLMDILIIFSSYMITAFLLHDDAISLLEKNINLFSNTVIISLFVYQIIFNLFDVYKNITRYENGKDYMTYIFASGFSGGIILLLSIILKVNFLNYRHIILATLISAVAMVSYRVIIRFILTTAKYMDEDGKEDVRKNLLIVGAGEASREIIKTIKSSLKNSYNIVGLIDDNQNKIDYVISGVKILGNRYKILEVCQKNKVDVIFFSITNISNKDKKEILSICQETGAKIRILPSIQNLIQNKNIFQNLRDVAIEDILGRDPIKLDNPNIKQTIENKVVLITGGGGSIGSELCRQVIKNNPSKLIILDIYENNLYEIEQELLRHKYEASKIEAIVGSVRDKKRLEQVFNKYKPDLVFHASAHKHVPLMEISPLEAIKNNIFGTYNVINYSHKYHVKRFLLISTDKAVNPTNIMGATKRMCEMMVQAKNKVSDTEFVAVRFGNVLGSNGSVVPLFKKQIADGGPVTVTHKEITRFFMTIPEAVGLILQATTYATGGEIFVLDMGEPVKIYDLAVSLIKLSGFQPDIDIKIEVSGLRKGEKLYEELLMSEEGLQKTAHNKIFVAEPMNITEDAIQQKLAKLTQILEKEDIALDLIKDTMKLIVPTYHEPSEINKILDTEDVQNNKLKKTLSPVDKLNNVATTSSTNV